MSTHTLKAHKPRRFTAQRPCATCGRPMPKRHYRSQCATCIKTPRQRDEQRRYLTQVRARLAYLPQKEQGHE